MAQQNIINIQDSLSQEMSIIHLNQSVDNTRINNTTILKVLALMRF